jgi:hypothetical protein
MPLAELRRTELAGTQPLRRTFVSLGERLRFGEREPWIVLAPLVVAQWIVVGVFALFFVQRNGWLFYQGGDQSWFYTSGWVVANGHIPETFVGWVWAVAMTPIAALFGPSFLAAAPAVVLLQFFLLLPLGPLLVYGIASRIGGRPLGYWAAAWWIVIPYAVIPLFVDRYHETYIGQALPQALGLTGLGDFPSMIAVLAAAYFAVRAIDSGGSSDAIVAGLVAGLAIGIKPANGLFVLAPLLALTATRRWRLVAQLGLALLPGVLVLGLWKQRGSGIAVLAQESFRLAADSGYPDFTPPTLWERVRGYVPLDREQLNYQFLGLREYFFSARLAEYLPIAGAVAVARRSIPLALFLSVWFGAFFVVKGSSPAVNVETGSIWRLLMPAWPAYFLLAAALPLLVPRLGAALAARFRTDAAAPRGVRRRGLAVAGLAAFGVPALAFATLPSDDSAQAAKIPTRSLFLPIDRDFRISATQRGDVLELTWPKPDTAGVRPFYVILRSPARYVFPYTEDLVVQGLRCRNPDGAIRCAIEMNEVDRTRGRVFNTRLERGNWTYRVGVAANWLDDPEAGDILVVSEPFDVAVR